MLSAIIFQQLRDYLNGRVILYSSTIMHDKNIVVGKYSGSVVKLGRLGLYIRTPEGLAYLSYSQIISSGFTLLAGKELGEYCNILVRAKSAEASISDMKRQLNETLITLPYIDWKFKPKVSGNGTIEGGFELKMLLHENVAAEEVCHFLNEVGFHCTIITSKTKKNGDIKRI